MATTVVAEMSDWLTRINVSVTDASIGSVLLLETQAGSLRALQETAIIDSLSPLLFPW